MSLGRIEASSSRVLTAMQAVVTKRQAHLRETYKNFDEVSYPQRMAQNFPLGFREYVAALKNIRRLRERVRDHGPHQYFMLREEPAELGLAARYNAERHTPDAQGWLSYLVDTSSTYGEYFASIPSAQLTEGERQGHTLIVAGSNHGKSELMKALAYHYVEADPGKASVVVIDPHGQMAQQIARWPQFGLYRERMVYIRPDLIDGHIAPLNPFALGRALPPKQQHDFGGYLGRMLTELLPKAELTQNMGMLASSCVRALMERPGSSLHDLYVMLGDKKDKDPARAALLEDAQNHPNDMLAEFFRGHFESDSLASSKAGLRNRLFSLLINDTFRQAVCADGCLDLIELIGKRRTIIFDLAGLGRDERIALGRIILMMLWSVGQVRISLGDKQAVPVHVFVDEASTLAGEAFGEFLKEYRKAGVHLTMAQQVAGDGFGGALTDNLLTNTAVKFAGLNRSRDAARMLGVGPEEAKALSDLPRGQFWCKWGSGSELVKLTVRNDLAGDALQMENWQWVTLVGDWQKAGHYQPIKKRQPPARAARSRVPQNDLPL